MEETRTTSVDRRLVVHVAQAVPGDVPEEVIKAHLREAALSHRLIQELLRADPTLVDQKSFSRVLRGEIWPIVPHMPIKEFRPGILDDVRALGGQFEGTHLTAVPGDETLELQRDDRVINFWTDWHFKLKPDDKWRLRVFPTIASQVIYLPSLVENSLGCTYDKTEEEGKKHVQEILDSLPRVEGLRWIVGSTPTVNRVLANHLKETGAYLLSGVYTWTTDTYEDTRDGLRRLVVGRFDSSGVRVDFLRSGESPDAVGVFALGVPE